jgi:PAS domain S-box-containing protein
MHFLSLETIFITPFAVLICLCLLLIIVACYLYQRIIFWKSQAQIANEGYKYYIQRFKTIYNAELVGFWETTFEGTVTAANDAFLNIIGYSRDDLEKRLINWQELTPPEYREITAYHLNKLRAEGTCPYFEKEYVHKDGHRVAVLLGSSLVERDGKIHIIAYTIDQSKAKEAEKREQTLAKQMLNKQNDTLQIFMDAPVCVVIRKGKELKIDFINNAAIAQNAIGRKSVEGTSTANYFSKVKTNFDIGVLKEVYNTGRPYKQNAFHLRYDRQGDGTIIDAWYDIVIQPTYNTNGEIDGIVTYTFDVSDLIMANEALKSSEARFRFIADAIPHKMWTSDADGTATYYNRGWYDYTGTSDLETLKHSIWSMIHPDDLESSKEKWQWTIKNGEDLEMEYRLLRYDGLYFWHLCRVCAQKDMNGAVKLWVGTSTNIHAQKTAIEEIERRENHFRTLANSNSMLIWQTNAHGETEFINNTWKAYTGIDEEHPTIAVLSQNIHPDDRDKAIEDLKKNIRNKSTYQSKYRFKDIRTGEYRWMLDNGEPLLNPEFSGFISSMTDIHEQEIAKLAIEEMMAKKDNFFSIASHELKTPITTVKASLQIIHQQLESHPTDDKLFLPLINRAERQVNKLTGIVNDLLTINKIQSGKLELSLSKYCFNESLIECVDQFRLQYPDFSIKVEERDTLEVLGDRVRMEQVIMNLLLNAIKYSPKKDPIDIRVEKEGQSLKCSVTDKGIGIPLSKQPYIFDRFFRVHENSQSYGGLGTGLFISAEIVKQHNGEINVFSKENEGATFWFAIPLC